MSLDRTEDVELVDATTLALSKIWRRQYEGLTNLTFKLDRDRINAVQYPDKKLGSLPNGDLTDVNGSLCSLTAILQSDFTSPVHMSDGTNSTRNMSQ